MTLVKTKTSVLLEHLQAGRLIEAMKIAKDFRIGFTKDENKTITRACEMEWNEAFYTALGFKKEEEQRKAAEILIEKYNKYLEGN